MTPDIEQRAVSGALFPSSMFAGRAPAGHAALSGYVGGSRASESAMASDRELIDTVRTDFTDLLGVRAAPVVSRIQRWPRGLPQPTMGHAARVGRLRAVEREWPGLYLTGNYFSGPGIASCVHEAAETVARITPVSAPLAISSRRRGGPPDDRPVQLH